MFTDNAGRQYIRGYVWGHGGYTVLDALPDGSGFSYATDINNHDQVVGYSYSAAGIEAVRWEHGTIESLGDLPGGTTNSTASTINERGTIVGMARDDTGFRAFLWRQGQMTALPIPTTAISSTAFDVSNADVVVGYYVDGGLLVPALWRNGTLQQLPYFEPTYTSAYAVSINESGDIVGLSAIGTTGVDAATLWHKEKPTTSTTSSLTAIR